MFLVTGLMTLFTLMRFARAADVIGRRNVICFSGVVAGIGAMVAAAVVSPLGFVIGNVVMTLGTGTGTAGPAPAAYAADIAPADKRGVAVGSYRSAGDAGFLSAPPLLGWLSEVTSLTTAMVVGGAMVAAGGVIFYVGSRGDPAAGTAQPVQQTSAS